MFKSRQESRNIKIDKRRRRRRRRRSSSSSGIKISLIRWRLRLRRRVMNIINSISWELTALVTPSCISINEDQDLAARWARRVRTKPSIYATQMEGVSTLRQHSDLLPFYKITQTLLYHNTHVEFNIQ